MACEVGIWQSRRCLQNHSLHPSPALSDQREGSAHASAHATLSTRRGYFVYQSIVACSCELESTARYLSISRTIVPPRASQAGLVGQEIRSTRGHCIHSISAACDKRISINTRSQQRIMPRDVAAQQPAIYSICTAQHSPGSISWRLCSFGSPMWSHVILQFSEFSCLGSKKWSKLRS